VSTVARHRAVGLLLLGVVLAGTPGCSIRRWAAGKLGDALASGGTSYASDDDPELVGDALPFALKTIEGTLETTPRHKGLLLAAASGFTQYAYVYLATEADYVEDADLARATHLRDRAMGLYRRAFGYGMRGLEVDHPGIRAALAGDAHVALAGMKKNDVPMLYWTSAAWSLVISLDKTNGAMAVDLPLAESLMHRALELDPSYGDGVIHDYYISYEGGRAGAAGGSIDRAREELAKALELARGRRAAPYLAFAESVSVGKQDRKEFTELLDAALAVKADAAPEYRLANVVAQRRARWLLSRIDALFVE
jgi:predicted anti-sigma-YlaC factor YlaD